MTLSPSQPNDPPNNAAAPCSGLDSRHIALSIVQAVLEQKQPLDQVLERERSLYALSPRDRGFVRMAVATTLRRLGQIDDLIARAMDKGEQPRPEILKNILRLGIAQIFFMDVPDHAAVDVSVQLAEANNLSSQKGFVNAVLRRMTSEGREWIKLQDEGHMNAPKWLLDQWIADYSVKEAAQIALANLAEASLDITIKNLDLIEMWAGSLEANILPTGTLRRPSGGRIEDLQGFDTGHWWVQDASAALPAHLFGDVNGRVVVDLCAAPGGKTAQLAAMGAHVIAVDRSAKRLQILKDNMQRLQLEPFVQTDVSDGTAWQPKEPVECLLLDAPCTATGTIRRHPDVLHLKTPQDQQRLVDVQKRLLGNAANILAPGGTLIYCTCSLQKDEGERQIENFLSAHPDFQISPISLNEVAQVKGLIQEDGTIRIFPFTLAAHGGMDGFYIARLRKA